MPGNASALKRAAVWLMAFTISVGALPGVASAEGAPKVVVNGRELAGAAMVPPGRILVPMRPLFEAMGATLYWDETLRAVRAFYPGHTVTLQVGNREAMTDGETVVLDAEPVLADGRMLVPLRFAVESLAGTVTWDQEQRAAVVTLPDDAMIPDTAVAPPPPIVPYTDEELALMVKVVNSEAFDEPYEGKVAVAAVILNRVRSPRFSADTIREVLTAGAPNHCQFNVVCNGLMNRLPIQADTRQAVLAALAGSDPSRGALFFANLSSARYQSFWASLTRTVAIGTHTFFK